MGWATSILIGVITGVIAFLAGGTVMGACCKWYRISSFEGGSGYAVLGVALLSGLAGTIAGVVVGRSRDAESGFGAAFGVAAGIVLGVAALAALVAWMLADIPPTIDGKELNFEVELRLPVSANSPLEGKGASEFTLGSVVNHTRRAYRDGELRTKDARLEDGRWIVPGSAFLFTTRGMRSFTFVLDGGEMQGFSAPVPRHPGREHLTWSDWYPRPRPPNPPWPDTKTSYRWRVSVIEPPPPGPTQEEEDAAAAAAKQEEFEAMPPDAPVKDWLPWARYGAPDDQKSYALARIETRETCADELGKLMGDEDRDVASEALRVIAELQTPPKALIPHVERIGRDIAERIRKFNLSKVEDDLPYEVVADISVRFSSWMEACRALRAKAGGDFSKELGEILVLSRVRTDSLAMRGDVNRVASYWMQQWTGLAPLPGDPPPR